MSVSAKPAAIAQEPIAWRCPNCGSGAVAALPTLLRCADCETRYPVLRAGKARLPLLFEQTGAALTQWWTRYNGFVSCQQQRIQRLEFGLRARHLDVARRASIEAEIAARKAHIRDITQVLRPLMDCPGWPTTATDGRTTQAALPAGQGLDSYLPNALRDWCWNASENSAQLAALQEVVTQEQLGARVLVAGSGAGRLGLDLFHWQQPALQVMLDINPLLGLIASRIIHGESLSIYEFPDSSAPFRMERRHRRPRGEGPQRRNCLSPDSTASLEGLEFVCADIMSAPFQAESFDSVITPWLIDILPHDMATVLPRLNELLAPGGYWVNSGSWVPAQSAPEQRYSESELMDLCAAHGFELQASAHKRIPYLQRPNSAQRRSERVWSFCLRKVKSTTRPQPTSYLPAWATDINSAIPPAQSLELVAATRHLEAQVLGAVDGKRTLQEIAAWIAAKYDLPEAAALLTVRQIVLDSLPGTPQ